MRIPFGICAALAALALSMMCTLASASLAPPSLEPAAPAVVLDHHDHQDADSGTMVAILVPLGSLGALVTLVLGGFYASHRRDQTRHQTIRAIVERGGEVPPDLLRTPVSPRSDLRRGVLLIAAGVGLMIVLGALVSEARVWTAGLVPVLLGLGYLLVWKIEPPPAARAMQAAPDRIE